MKTKTLLSLILLFAAACAPVSSAVMVDVDESAVEPLVAEEVIDQPSEPAIPTYSLDFLEQKPYGLGELRVEYPWHNEAEFTRYYITYDSDDLNIHGFVNIPVGNGPFPVVIALHGYIPASEYETLDYSTRYADSIARKGYIVLHPNMRNFPPSDYAPRRGDYHLSRIGLWGHSLGGSVALRVAALVQETKAVVLYAAVTQRYSNGSAGARIYDLENTDAAFQVHHGLADRTVRPQDSTRFCAQLEDAGAEHECFFYEDAPHTFIRLGQDDPLFIQRVVDFYLEELG